MENLNQHSPSTQLSKNNGQTVDCTSYRGFVSIDQEMGKEIALAFFSSCKETLVSQKSFLSAKH